MTLETFLRAMAVVALGLLLAGAGIVAAQTAQPAPKQSAPPAAAKSAAPKPKPTAPPQLQLEPKAVEILKAVSNRLAAAHTLSFNAVEAFESLSRQGAPLVYANKYEVTLERPNKLRVILAGDGPASEFYYDGKMTMAFSPTENLVAIADAPPTIDKTLEEIYRRASIYFPFTDLLVADPYGDLAPGLKHAYYVGQSSVIGGTTTDIVAYMGDGVFVQMWIGTEDKLPRMMHAVFLDDPDNLRHNLMLSDWQIDNPVSDDVFTTSKAATARRMGFATPPAGPRPGVKPPAKAKPANLPAPSTNK